MIVNRQSCCNKGGDGFDYPYDISIFANKYDADYLNILFIYCIKLLIKMKLLLQ